MDPTTDRFKKGDLVEFYRSLLENDQPFIIDDNIYKVNNGDIGLVVEIKTNPYSVYPKIYVWWFNLKEKIECPFRYIRIINRRP